MKREDIHNIDPADSAWEMCTKTGHVSYYLLYKKLVKK
jgi:hypothetical protein